VPEQGPGGSALVGSPKPRATAAAIEPTAGRHRDSRPGSPASAASTQAVAPSKSAPSRGPEMSGSEHRFWSTPVPGPSGWHFGMSALSFGRILPRDKQMKSPIALPLAVSLI